MNLLEGIRRIFKLDGTVTDKDGNKITHDDAVDDGAFLELFTEVSYKKLAIDSCVNLIAATLAGCEFITFEDGKEVRKRNHHLFNVKPNINQNAAEFWCRFVAKLLKNNQALIVQHTDGTLHVADSFNIKEYAFYSNIYDGVTVGTLTLSRRFYGDEVLHVRLHDENIRKLIDGIYLDYGKLIAFAGDNYKRKNALRLLIEEPTVSPMNDDTRGDRREVLSQNFKTWLGADNPVGAVVLPKGLKVSDWSNSDRAQQTSRDMRALIDDIVDFTCKAYRVPARLLRGDVAELNQSIDALIAFAINPLAELIADEINAKMYSVPAYLRRTYIKVDTEKVKMIDPSRFAQAADKLFAAGVHSINDNRRMLGRTPIDEPWADRHFITKNYEKAETLLEGGENDADTNAEN